MNPYLEEIIAEEQGILLKDDQSNGLPNKSFIKMDSIQPFKKIQTSLKSAAKDLNSNDIPFTITPKIHGTNGGFCFNIESEEIWCQSRTNILSESINNYDFFEFFTRNKDILLNHFTAEYSYNLRKDVEIEKAYTYISNKLANINPNEYIKNIVINGEYAGNGISWDQGIGSLNRRVFIAFSVRLVVVKYKEQEILVDYTLPLSSLNSLITLNAYDIYSITQFNPTELTIQADYTKLSQNTLVDLMQSVENECPVAKYFNCPSLIGEGIVAHLIYDGKVIRFKVKGAEHSSSSVIRLFKIDEEELKKVIGFIEYAVTEGRLNQFYHQLFISKGIALKKDEKYKDVLNLFSSEVIEDILKEESDELDAFSKDDKNNIFSKIRKKCKEWLNSKVQ